MGYNPLCNLIGHTNIFAGHHRAACAAQIVWPRVDKSEMFAAAIHSTRKAFRIDARFARAVLECDISLGQFESGLEALHGQTG